MKEGFFPLINGLVMLSLTGFIWYTDANRSYEAELLASEVKTFLQNHRTESSAHLTAYQQAQQLSLLIQSPNRMLLGILSSVFAVQCLSQFLQNSKGRLIVQKFSKTWTWRP